MSWTRVLGVVLLAIVPECNAFLPGIQPRLGGRVLVHSTGAWQTSPSRSSCGVRPPRASWHASLVCQNVVAGACTSDQVEVVPATEQMFVNLAQLRVGELSKNFAGMSQREAELLEMNKRSHGTTCLVATVPASDVCAAGMAVPAAPGVSNVREMLELGWMTQEVRSGWAN